MKRAAFQSPKLHLHSLVAVSLLAFSCATPGQRIKSEVSRDSVVKVADLGKGLAAEDQEIEEGIEETESELELEMADSDDDGSGETVASDDESAETGHGRIPIEINRNVRKWIQYFAIQDRDRFQRFLKRGHAYKAMVEGILRANGVPAELYYLAMIESGYSTKARSRAKAVGAWQFVRATGKQYGLQQNAYVDERKDVIRATQAAAKHLKNLHKLFGSWYLAMAAYNAGEGRIQGAIQRGGTRDFWELAARHVLPLETRDYVPKFLAAAIIGKNPEKFGFSAIASAPFPNVEAARVPGGVRLSQVASKTGISPKTLTWLNSHLSRGITPTHARTYPIWVPAGTGRKVASIAPSLRRVRVAEKPGKPKRAIASKANRYYRVRPGDALAQIAELHGISVSTLKRINRLRSARIYVGQKLRVRI